MDGQSRTIVLNRSITETSTEPNLFGASGWLLQQWRQAEVVREVDQTPIPYPLDREWFTLAITVTPKSPTKPKEEPEDRSIN